MNIIIFANCQGKFFEHYLREKMQKSQIKSITHISNHLSIIDGKDFIKDRTTEKIKERDFYRMLNNTDLFIYQPIKSKYGKYTTDLSFKFNLLIFLKNGCKVISFPNIYNYAFFPIINNTNDLLNIAVIKKLKLQKKSLQDIFKLYDDNKLDFNYKKRYNKTIKILREKEQNTIIKVCDIIEKYKHIKRLFLSEIHPTNFLMVHCINQMFKLLKYNNYIINPLSIKRELKTYNINKKSYNIIPISKYDIKYWNLNIQPDENADNFYKNIISIIYNKI